MVKSFYSTIGEPDVSFQPAQTCVAVSSAVNKLARIAVYDAPAAAPRVVDVAETCESQYIESLSSKVYSLVGEQGGSLPYTVIRELVENFIHAGFAEPVVSILDGGATVRFADQGPGISDKNRALLPGFTTATSSMKQHIRGVGSGLPIVSEFLRVSGGSLSIDDNLGSGSVITVHYTPGKPSSNHGDSRAQFDSFNTIESHEEDGVQPRLSMGLDKPTKRAKLTTRQKHVLALVLESGTAGPSIVSRELGIGLSTAYRDLAYLEELGLIASNGGKRTLTDRGMSYLDDFSS